MNTLRWLAQADRVHTFLCVSFLAIVVSTHASSGGARQANAVSLHGYSSFLGCDDVWAALGTCDGFKRWYSKAWASDRIIGAFEALRVDRQHVMRGVTYKGSKDHEAGLSESQRPPNDCISLAAVMVVIATMLKVRSPTVEYIKRHKDFLVVLIDTLCGTGSFDGLLIDPGVNSTAIKLTTETDRINIVDSHWLQCVVQVLGCESRCFCWSNVSFAPHDVTATFISLPCLHMSGHVLPDNASSADLFCYVLKLECPPQCRCRRFSKERFVMLRMCSNDDYHTDLDKLGRYRPWLFCRHVAPS